MIGRNPRTNEPETLHSRDRALLVHPQTAGFREKRQFRAYREFSANTTIKFVAAKPFYLTFQSLWTGAGAARMVVSTGGTESGTFTPVATAFCKYLLDGPVVGSTALSAGGTVTLGSEREVLRADSGTAGGGTGSTSTGGGERALPAGTYYFTITVTGTTAGMYALEWEELP
jgi:hypothetical protein